MDFRKNHLKTPHKQSIPHYFHYNSLKLFLGIKELLLENNLFLFDF